MNAASLDGLKRGIVEPVDGFFYAFSIPSSLQALAMQNITSAPIDGQPCARGRLLKLQAISKKSFGTMSLLEAKFKFSEYLSMPPVKISPPPRSGTKILFLRWLVDIVICVTAIDS